MVRFHEAHGLSLVLGIQLEPADPVGKIFEQMKLQTAWQLLCDTRGHWHGFEESNEVPAEAIKAGAEWHVLVQVSCSSRLVQILESEFLVA